MKREQSKAREIVERNKHNKTYKDALFAVIPIIGRQLFNNKCR